MRAMKKQIDNLSVDLCVFSVNLCVIPRRANGERWEVSGECWIVKGEERTANSEQTFFPKLSTILHMHRVKS